MIKLILLGLIISIGLATGQTVMKLKWVSHMKQFGLKYKSLADKQNAFNTFTETEQRIKSNNNNPKADFLMAHNQFSTISFETLKATILQKKRNKPQDSINLKEPKAENPQTNTTPRSTTTTRTTTSSSITKASNSSSSTIKASYKSSGVIYSDWRAYITGIQEQGECGCDYAFASVGVIEAYYAIQTGVKTFFSKQQMVDCSTNNYGCSGGTNVEGLLYVKNEGIVDEADYSYTGNQSNCTYNSTNVVNLYNIGGYKLIRGETAIIAQLAFGPVAVYMQTTIEFMNYISGIYPGNTCSNNPSDTNHALLIVGHGTENGKKYWILKNSWGLTWGENGYGRIMRNSKCSLEAECYVPTSVTKII